MTREEVIRVLRSPEGREETRLIYRLRIACDLATQVIEQRSVTREQAEELVDGLEKLATAYFPDSSETFRIIYGRRFQRLINDTFGPPAA